MRVRSIHIWRVQWPGEVDPGYMDTAHYCFIGFSEVMVNHDEAREGRRRRSRRLPRSPGVYCACAGFQVNLK